MKRAVFFALCFFGASGLAARAQTVAGDPAPPAKPTVQLAILLDTSNSMDGLIDQAKTQLWNVVNEFVRAARTAGRRLSRWHSSNMASARFPRTRASCG